ncbi:MAG: hypothetical protein KAV82_08390 [Phycisphaerae bacterium]|nr:hypothetical protein [Phycisphaerae bacterium]
MTYCFHKRVSLLAIAVGVWLAGAVPTSAQLPFATTVIEYAPAPGQLVNDSLFNNPIKAIGRPYAGGFENPDNSSLATLGGFGGYVVLGFDHTVRDDPANPFGIDAIVYGNAFWVSGNPNRKWAECGFIEISRDLNSNGLADDPWYLIPGSHVTDPVGQWETQTWDDNIEDLTYPPHPVSPQFPYQNWIPPGCGGVWDTQGYRLPSEVFDVSILQNPNGAGATEEGVFGYADCSPTLILGDLDADNIVDDPEMTPEEFYTVPDDPLEVGMSPGAGGGDAFDIAWAIDPTTGQAANLNGFNFIRITNGVNFVTELFGEISTEIDAVADVVPGLMGDGNWDGVVDLRDLAVLEFCMTGPNGDLESIGYRCRVMDFDGDDDVDLRDFAKWQTAFTE